MTAQRDKRIWIGNGTLVCQDRLIQNGSVLVEDGKIIALNQPCPQDAAELDACQGYILPGFIDLHVHGGGGADFTDAVPGCVQTAARMHGLHGTTAMVPTTMTCPDELLEKTILNYLEEAGTPFDGPELLGLHLEGPFFATGGKSRGAQPVTSLRIPDRETLEHFITLAQGTILRWDEAPELHNSELFARVMREHGIMPSIAHTDAMAAEAYQAFEWGFSHITHLLSATNWARKQNGRTYGGLNEAALLRDDITVELICDGCHVPKEMLLLIYKIKGSGRIALITDAMRAAGTDATESVLGSRDAGVPVVILNGVAQLPDLSFFAGSIGTMDRALRYAHLDCGIPLPEVSMMLSGTPAKIAGCFDRKGTLTVGKDADIVVMDSDFSIKSVFARGTKLV